MGNSEFELFEKDFMELLSEARLREVIRTEATRAEAAEAAKQTAERAAADARASAAAATAAAAHAAQSLANTHDETISLKMKLEIAERQHSLIEEKHTELLNQVATLDKELQQLRPIQSAHTSLKNQYIELLNRIKSATEDARSESSRLGNELRRVEKCASAGLEIRERARLAATAHARERRLTAAEIQHTSKELCAANVEITRLGALVTELQYRLSELRDGKPKSKSVKDPDQESLLEVRAALESERAGAARLERSLAAALADNAMLASKLHANDNTESPTTPHNSNGFTNICPIDSFLED
ncbi:uncharacterized protein [Epargyreus clarus]|uniref:uncharacterized protein n=1 Tax=Epargyreus clarus TaxID=520877 RepID=UPI003C2B6540